jgi:hypothetical protein
LLDLDDGSKVDEMTVDGLSVFLEKP